MALKIRCPHCRKILLAEDWTAGEGRFCPGCGKGFTVPLPRRAAERETTTPTIALGVTCARCTAQLAPGTVVCRHCLSDPHTGQRLPLRQRMRHVSKRFWGTLAASLAFLGLAGYATAYLVHLNQRSESAPTPMTAKPSTGVDWSASVAELLKSTTAATRAPMRRKLMLNAVECAPRVAEALEAAVQDGMRANEQTLRSRRAAIDILGETHDARWIPVLRRCQEDPGLREAAIRARAQVGDAAVAADATDLWLARLRETAFTDRAAELVRCDDPTARVALAQNAHWNDASRRRRETQASLTSALRHLGLSAVDRAAPNYWTTWGWLGQQRGEFLAAAVFDLARPESTATIAGTEDAVAQQRAARRVLEQVAQATRSYSTKCAVLLTLAQCVPQYQSLRERLLDNVITGLSEPDAQVQQRIVWTLAKVIGRSFGAVSSSTHPAFIDADGVDAVAAWARDVGKLNAPAAPFGAADRRRPPLELARRVLTAERQREAELLPAFEGDSTSALAAVKSWSADGLGFTPRIAALLDPGRRAPNIPGLLAAFAIAAEGRNRNLDDPALAPAAIDRSLTIWRDAHDQPATVRFAAGTALAALHAAAGMMDDNWPGAVPLREDEPLDSATIEILARIVAAGGPKLIARADDAKMTGIPAAIRPALVRAANVVHEARAQK